MWTRCFCVCGCWVLVLMVKVYMGSSWSDQYAEMIAHLPLFAHEDPRHVLLIGGGDGAALCEILKVRLRVAILILLIFSASAQKCGKCHDL